MEKTTIAKKKKNKLQDGTYFRIVAEVENNVGFGHTLEVSTVKDGSVVKTQVSENRGLIMLEAMVFKAMKNMYLKGVLNDNRFKEIKQQEKI